MTPIGPIKTKNPSGGSFGIDWSAITRWEREAGLAAVEFAVPVSRILATMVIESGGNELAIQRNHSNGFSYGLMQIVPYGIGWAGWWERVQQIAGIRGQGPTIDALYDGATNLRVGASILRDLHRQHGSWDKASSAFFLGNPDWRGQDTVNGNTGEGYRRSLNGLIEEYGEGGTMPELAYRTAIIPAGRPNRPGSAMNTGGPRYLTVHETGNTSTGANAEAHRRFVDEQRGGNDNVSFHLVVDDKEAIQLLPFTEIAFHASDGCDNRSQDLGCFDSIAIETCVNRDGNWEQTLRNLEALMAKLIRERPTLSVDRIRQHNTWAADRKNCPQRIRESGRWDEVVNATRALLGTTPAPDPAPGLPLPTWATEAHVKAAFPDFDARYPVSKAYLRYITKTNTLPVYREVRGIDDDSSLWVFDRVAILHEGNGAKYEGEA